MIDQPLKQHVQQLLVLQETERAIDCLLAFDFGQGRDSLRVEILKQQRSYDEYRRIVEKEGETIEAKAVLKRIHLDLLDLLEEIPPHYAVKGSRNMLKKAAVLVSSFRKRLLGIYTGGMSFLLLFLHLLWESGSFTTGEYWQVFVLLISAFGASIGLIIYGLRNNTYQEYIAKSSAWRSYLYSFCCLVFIGGLLHLRGPGSISYMVMLLSLGGVVLLQVLFLLFAFEGEKIEEEVVFV